MENLPVYWASNKKAWMLSSLYREWFEKYFVPPVKAYCERKKMPFKILLLVDNCKAHPDLQGVNPNVTCMYLPPNTTALIQPMDQGVISTVKAIYKKITFSKAHEKNSTLAEFLKTYNIYNAVQNFGQAWGQITRKNMRGVWNNLLQRTEKAYEPPITEIIEEVVDLGQQIGIENLNSADVIEAINFDHTEFTDRELIELIPENVIPDADGEEIVEKPTKLTSILLNKIIENFQYACDFASENDPFEERSSKIIKDIKGCLISEGFLP